MLVSVVILFTSCCNLFPTKITEKETYKPDIVWKLDAAGEYSPGTNPTVNNEYLYFIELPEDGGCIVNKVDMSDGRYVWKSKAFDSEEDTTIAVCSNKVYVYMKDHFLYCLSDDDGNILAKIRFDKDFDWKKQSGDRFSPGNFLILSYDRYLYWATGNGNDRTDDDGIARFDTSLVDFTEGSDTVQTIVPDFIYTYKNQNQPVWENIVEKDGILYFMTEKNSYINYGDNQVGAVDALTGELVWEHSTTIPGGASNGMYIAGNKLYAIDWSPGCYELATGNTIYEKVQSMDDLMHEVYLGSSLFSRGPYYYDGKFYYTNGNSGDSPSMNGCPEKYNKNILCMNAVTGSYVWGDMPDNGYSLASKPIVVNGKAYFFCDDLHGLRVYDSETGELLGVNTSYKTGSWACPVLYQNTIIFFNSHDNTKTTTVTAFKAD
jgi:hypothetical protein